MSEARGFTLIELLVSIVIAMVILAGIVSFFVAQSNVSRTQSDRANTMEDLLLAAQLIQRELLTAKGSTVDLYTSGTQVRLDYQNLDGYSYSFWYNHPSTGGANPMLGSGTLCWRQPGNTTCTGNDELLRGLSDPYGFVVQKDTSVDPYAWSITLEGTFLDVDKQQKPAKVQFKVWPRNP